MVFFLESENKSKMMICIIFFDCVKKRKGFLSFPYFLFMACIGVSLQNSLFFCFSLG